MLGLGWTELLIVAAAIAFIAGPAALPRIVRAVRSVDGARRDLRRRTSLSALLGADEALDELADRIDPPEEERRDPPPAA